MARVIWSEPAADDLRQVYEYIARDSTNYADAMMKRIQDAVERLGAFPRMGRIVHDISGDRREVIEAPYRIIYRYIEDQDAVVVESIVHGRRRQPPR